MRDLSAVRSRKLSLFKLKQLSIPSDVYIHKEGSIDLCNRWEKSGTESYLEGNLISRLLTLSTTVAAGPKIISLLRSVY